MRTRKPFIHVKTRHFDAHAQVYLGLCYSLGYSCEVTVALLTKGPLGQ